MGLGARARGYESWHLKMSLLERYIVLALVIFSSLLVQHLATMFVTVGMSDQAVNAFIKVRAVGVKKNLCSVCVAHSKTVLKTCTQMERRLFLTPTVHIHDGMVFIICMTELHMCTCLQMNMISEALDCCVELNQV